MKGNKGYGTGNIEILRNTGKEKYAVGPLGGGEGNLEQGTEADSAGYTDPGQARDFVESTGIDALAVSIGTVHGPFKGKPRLDLERLAEIRSLVRGQLRAFGTLALESL